MKFDFKKILPHLLAIAAFALIAIVYTYPSLKGLSLDQKDMQEYSGMAKEATDYYKATGDAPLWSNNMFGGMPTLVTYTGPAVNMIGYLNKVLSLWLPQPANMLFLAMLGMYFLLCVMGVRNWVSAIGGIAYGFSSYNVVIIIVGHITKMMCMAYMAPVIAGIWLVLQGRYLLGGTVTALMLALLIGNNHLQITYYTMLIVACIAITTAIYYIMKKNWAALVKTSVVLVIAAIMGVLPTAELWMVQRDYAKYTMRGSQSELTAKKDSAATPKQSGKSGLDIEYAYRWSYGKYETFTLLIPRLVGGSNAEKISESAKSAEMVAERGGDAESYASGAPLYFGPQPGTSGTVYFGAIICFLFVLSLFIVKSWHKWWLLAAGLLGIFMSWGNHFLILNEFLFNYLPLYNKFRTPSMSLVIPQVTFVALGCWGLHTALQQENDRKKLVKPILYSLAITAGLAFLLGVIGSFMGDFSAASDKQVFGENKDLINALRDDRAAALRNDALRSIFFILLAGGALWAWATNRLKAIPVIAIVGAAVLLDMVGVASRYLSPSKFVEQEKIDEAYTPTAADNSITKDKDPYYRVLNLAKDPFNDAMTSYMHKSVGGYSPAKLWIYQDMIENQIYPNIQNIANRLQAGGTLASFDSAMMQNPVLNMLNTKYVITNEKSAALSNRFACGNAWFVSNIKWAANANEEMASLTDFNPKSTAVIDKRFEKTVGALQPAADSVATIKLTKYGLNSLQYEANNSKDGLGVFSEIWYDGGWKAYIDGKETPLVRVNYVLRGLVIPAGKHNIEMKFEPQVFFTSRNISKYSSWLLIALVLAVLALEFFKGRKKVEEKAV